MRVLELGIARMLGFQLLQSKLKSAFEFFVVGRKKISREKILAIPLENIYKI
jgi:hypothetical protein